MSKQDTTPLSQLCPLLPFSLNQLDLLPYVHMYDAEQPPSTQQKKLSQGAKLLQPTWLCGGIGIKPLNVAVADLSHVKWSSCFGGVGDEASRFVVAIERG